MLGHKPLVDVIAQACHEANKVLCEALGDFSQKSWSEAPEWQRVSCMRGVLHLMGKPAAGPEASHENWLRDKQDAGWVYGPEKDADAKTHPCMVPHDQLPPEQQLKDVLFHAIVRALGGN